MTFEMGRTLQTHKGLSILGVVVVAILLALVMTNNFRIDNTGGIRPFGVYDSALTQAARYNPIVETIGFVESIALLLSLIILSIGRFAVKGLRAVRLLPWSLSVVGVLFALFIWPMHFGYDHSSFNPLVSSELPTLLLMQIPILAGSGIGLLLERGKSQKDVPRDTED